MTVSPSRPPPLPPHSPQFAVPRVFETRRRVDFFLFFFLFLRAWRGSSRVSRVRRARETVRARSHPSNGAPTTLPVRLLTPVTLSPWLLQCFRPRDWWCIWRPRREGGQAIIHPFPGRARARSTPPPKPPLHAFPRIPSTPRQQRQAHGACVCVCVCCARELTRVHICTCARLVVLCIFVCET